MARYSSIVKSFFFQEEWEKALADFARKFERVQANRQHKDDLIRQLTITREKKLETLRSALKSEDDEQIRKAMNSVVPTFHSPKSVNKAALETGTYLDEANGIGSKVIAG